MNCVMLVNIARSAAKHKGQNWLTIWAGVCHSLPRLRRVRLKWCQYRVVLFQTGTQVFADDGGEERGVGLGDLVGIGHEDQTAGDVPRRVLEPRQVHPRHLWPILGNVAQILGVDADLLEQPPVLGPQITELPRPSATVFANFSHIGRLYHLDSHHPRGVTMYPPFPTIFLIEACVPTEGGYCFALPIWREAGVISCRK